MDVKRYPRFARPGHAVTGDRSRTHAEKVARLGDDFFHAVVDDHSRLTYGELPGDERAATVTAFVERALAWFAERGITARRLMTDGAWSCTRKRSPARSPSARSATSLRRPARRAGTARWSALTACRLCSDRLAIPQAAGLALDLGRDVGPANA
jgi:hypothetical protein